MEGRVKFLLLPAIIIIICCVQDTAQQSRQRGRKTSGWGEWGPLSGCSKPCGTGVRKRVRTWHTAEGEPPLEVPFTTTEQFTCFEKACPQNGSWSGWAMWRECSVACGGGVRRRYRDCDTPPPMYGGLDCKGDNFTQEPCSLESCPPLPPNFNMSICSKAKMFICDSGQICVPRNQLCDDTVQCNDGSDEVGCWKYGYKIGRVHFSNTASYVSLSAFLCVPSALVILWSHWAHGAWLD